jgi:hypothetical protein
MQVSQFSPTEKEIQDLMNDPSERERLSLAATRETVTEILLKAKLDIKDVVKIITDLSMGQGYQQDKDDVEKDVLIAHEMLLERDSGTSFADEIRDWVMLQDGTFSLQNGYKELQVVTKKDKVNFRVIIKRLEKQGLIEKNGSVSGCYRIKNDNVREIIIDDSEDLETEYPVILPMNLNSMCQVYENSIILCAGESNAGKTAFLLNILKDNKGRLPIRYITSEMDKQEFKKRFRGFTDVPKNHFNSDPQTQYVYQKGNYQDIIMPGALNFIDYLEIEDYTSTASILACIHERLKGGIAVVAVQKKEGSRLGRGGDMLMEKPRLAISLYDPQLNYFIAEITKMKFPRPDGARHNHKQCKYDLVYGSRIRMLTEWVSEKFNKQ